MFADSAFAGLKGNGKREWRDFQNALRVRLEEMRDGVGQDGVIEETHHIGLACELVEACLQPHPEDRWVYGCMRQFICAALPYIPL